VHQPVAPLATLIDMAVTVNARRRPVGVTIVVGLGLVQAVLLLIVGVALVVARDEPGVADQIAGSPAVLLGTGVSVAVIGDGAEVRVTWIEREQATTGPGG
jgi:hypothetical protein